MASLDMTMPPCSADPSTVRRLHRAGSKSREGSSAWRACDRYARHMPGSIRIARILGIDIRIHGSWILIFFLVVLSLSESIFPDQYPLWGAQKTFIIAAITAALFFASVLAHELAHSLVARRFRMSVSSITLFLLGGVANLTREPPSAKAEFFMAAAGPLTSIVIGVVGVAVALATEASLSNAPWLQVVGAVAG